MVKRLRSLMGAQDMTVGSPLSVMLKFAIPLLIGNIAQMSITTVNSIVLGRFVSREALGAVGASAPIMQMFLVFFMTVSTGVTVVVSQYFGAKDRENLSKSVGTAITMTLIATSFITLIGIPLAGPVLRLTGVGDNVTEAGMNMLKYANQYLVIMFIGTIGQGFYNILSGILRGMGEAVFPLFILLGTSIIGILLNLVFIGVFNLGVVGVGLATILAQYASAVVCLIRITKMRETLDLTRDMLKPDPVITRQVLRIGLPSGIMQAILSMSYVFVQSLTNSILIFNAAGIATNTIFVACNAALSGIDNIAHLPNQTFSNAGSTFAAQNIGAGKMDRVNQSFKLMVGIGLTIAGIMVVVVLVFGRGLLNMFINPSDPDYEIIIALGRRMQRIMVFNYLVMAVMQSVSGILRGAGDTLPIMWSTILATVPLRVPMAYLMVTMTKSALYPAGDPIGIHLSMLICFSIAATGCVLRYRSGKWREKAVIKMKPAEAVEIE